MYSTSVQCYINVIIIIIIMFIGLHRTIFHYIKQIQVPVQISIKVLKTDSSRVYIIFAHVLFFNEAVFVYQFLICYVKLTIMLLGFHVLKLFLLFSLQPWRQRKKLHFRMEKIHSHFSLGCPIVDCQIFFINFWGEKFQECCFKLFNTQMNTLPTENNISMSQKRFLNVYYLSIGQQQMVPIYIII